MTGNLFLCIMSVLRRIVHQMEKKGDLFMIILDYQDRRPLYEQIAEKMRLLIIQGVLKPEEQMPSVRKLAVELAINPNTIQRAYTELEQQGFIYPVKGRGNFISPNLEIVAKRKELFYGDLKKLVRKAKGIGIEKDEFLNKTEEYFKEEQA